MSLQVPLAVRIFNNWGKAFDVWVTEWVEKLSYRSIIPGGFANANIVLHNSKPDLFSQIVKIYNRVQIVDWTTGQIEWEGRIEEPKRNEESHSWEIGCLGSMILASDVRVPYFAIDGNVSNWIVATAAMADETGPSVNEDSKTLTFSPQKESYTGPNHWEYVFEWQQAKRCDMRIGRFDATYQGGGASANFRTGIDIYNSAGAIQQNVDLTAWNAVSVRKANAIGAASSFTSTDAQTVGVAFDWINTTTMVNGMYGSVVQPRVQAQRVDRYGTKLQTAADYPNDWVTVPQIVEDVAGRFLVGAYHWQWQTIPFDTKKIKPEEVFIDTTATAKITDFTFYDGATAAEILNGCMNAQANQYWAIWESSLREDTNNASNYGFSFEWRSWDQSWGYRATTIDGIEEQPDGEEPYNGLFMVHQNPDFPQTYVQTTWTRDGARSNFDLDAVWLNRTHTVIKEESIASGVALDVANAELDKMGQTKNTGMIRVSRPIHCYDPGTNGREGMNRMMPPHSVRPGRLIAITDMPVEARMDNFPFGTSPYLREQDSAVFRMIATTYDSDTNTVDVELDQVVSRNVANQIARPKPKGKLVVKG